MLNMTFFVSLKCQHAAFLLHFYFSGLQESKCEAIDISESKCEAINISNLRGPERDNVSNVCISESKCEAIDISNLRGPERDNVRLAFVRSGFADDRSGSYKLRPCPLGTFADSSLTDPNCKNCAAGKL